MKFANCLFSQITYDGWSSIYDEFVIPENCKAANGGEQITVDTNVHEVLYIIIQYAITY